MVEMAAIIRGELYSHPMIQRAYDEGNLIATAQARIGPAGREKAWLMSIISMQDFMANYRAMQSSSRVQRKVGIRSLQSSLRRMLLAMDGAELSMNDDFLADLGVLVTAKMVWGPEVEVGTGLDMVQLAVHPDASRDRARRGMLPESIEAELAAKGVDIVPRAV